MCKVGFTNVTNKWAVQISLTINAKSTTFNDPHFINMQCVTYPTSVTLSKKVLSVSPLDHCMETTWRDPERPNTSGPISSHASQSGPTRLLRGYVIRHSTGCSSLVKRHVVLGQTVCAVIRMWMQTKKRLENQGSQAEAANQNNLCKFSEPAS